MRIPHPGSPFVARDSVRISIIPILLVLGITMNASSQTALSQSREMRAVWLTTLSGLDWPSASLVNRPEEQKSALVEILDNCQRLGLTTVFLQVRSRGNAFYRSSFEPWSGELAGGLGKDPGWDPLEFAVRECHARGLDLHAWVNIFKVWSGSSSPPRSTPLHVAHAHPEWVTPYKGEQWIDPGVPAARDWLVDVCMDIVRRYDIDGIHLDYTRYPEVDFTDEGTWSQFGGKGSKADWRRENIASFVRDLYKAVRGLKPHCLVGVAPIGIYVSLPTARGWEGRNALGQDSRAWLHEGFCDYVVPQVYWGLKEHGSRIDFEALAKDWATHASGRPAVIGIAAYREEVAPWLDEHVTTSRRAGAQGQAFFRYQHIASGEKLAGVYQRPALPPAFPWRDPVRPNPPRTLTLDESSGQRLARWQAPIPATDGETADRYAVYRTQAKQAPELLAVLAADTREWNLPQGMILDELSITAVDRVRNESTHLRSTSIPARPVLAAAPSTIAIEGIGRPTDAGDLVLLAYAVAERSVVHLRLLDEDGKEVSVIVNATQNPGTYVVGLEKSRVPSQAMFYVFEAGITVQTEELTLDSEDE